MAEDGISIIELIDSLILQAIVHNASDIHWDATEQGLRVRYRIDGILHDKKTISLDLAPQIVARLKILSGRDIAERRMPQDGKFSIALQDRAIDVRLSTFPGVYGETLVLRILDRQSMVRGLDQLGMSAELLAVLEVLIYKEHGFFLVTGPTGSGKTTTLYAILSTINSPEKNIITLEDPVEYILAGTTQGQINADIGFTFSRGVRAILRQDPDVAMIGEIRDPETARIAIEAALSGHLVLSTLHTNSAPGTIIRLMDMGVEAFLINAALTGVLAQRLVRKLCTTCRFERMPTEQEAELLSQYNRAPKIVFDAQGCEDCFMLGCKGRIGIFELLIMTDSLRALIIQNPHIETLYKQAYHDGLRTLFDDGFSKVEQGIISVQELINILA